MSRSNAFGDIPPTRIGRVRTPTSAEKLDAGAVLRADAVLAMVTREISLEPLERHVADLIDGHRPVARIKKKSGLSTEDVIEGLRKLRARGVLALAGIVEDAGALPLEEMNEEQPEFTATHGARDVIPPHVMQEIQAMLEDIERARAQEDGDSVLEEDHVEFEDAATTKIKAHQDQTE